MQRAKSARRDLEHVGDFPCQNEKKEKRRDDTPYIHIYARVTTYIADYSREYAGELYVARPTEFPIASRYTTRLSSRSRRVARIKSIPCTAYSPS